LLNKLYTVVEKSHEKIVLQLSDERHPIFQAHFPKHPILPGFILIDMMAEILNDNVIYIRQSKFIGELLPNDTLSCEVLSKGKNRNIKVFKNQQKVSHISYESK